MAVRRASWSLLVASAVVGVCVVPVTAVEAGPAAECHGQPATHVGGTTGVVRGTEGDDVILSDGAHVEALGGNDVVCQTGVGPVNDSLGAGVDYYSVGDRMLEGTVSGGAGRDVLSIDNPAILLRADLADSTLYILRTSNPLRGASQVPNRVSIPKFEEYRLRAYKVAVLGSSRPEKVDLAGCRLIWTGDGGADRVRAHLPAIYRDNPNLCSEPVASLHGDAGNDDLFASMRARLSGGDGRDRVVSTSRADRLSGGTGADYLAAGGQADVIDGGAGRDTIMGGTGRDRADGGAGPDTCRQVEAKTSCER